MLKSLSVGVSLVGCLVMTAVPAVGQMEVQGWKVLACTAETPNFMAGTIATIYFSENGFVFFGGEKIIARVSPAEIMFQRRKLEHFANHRKVFTLLDEGRDFQRWFLYFRDKTKVLMSAVQRRQRLLAAVGAATEDCHEAAASRVSIDALAKCSNGPLSDRHVSGIRQLGKPSLPEV